ncbi:hypothetical protein C1I97_19460 [Streptomyces sp. NTH33]|nr:hypothetical protein C1I97_19460 [Streptomyces sp. NTH33]
MTKPEPSAPACPGDKAGPCSVCRRRTHTYGSGGGPLCRWCMARPRPRPRPPCPRRTSCDCGGHRRSAGTGDTAAGVPGGYAPATAGHLPPS